MNVMFGFNFANVFAVDNVKSYVTIEKNVDKFSFQIFRINIKINNGDRGMES